MLPNIIATFLIFLFSGVFALVFGQTPSAAIKPVVISGDVITISDKKIVANTKTGPLDVVITDKSVFKRVSAENPNFATATAGALTDIGVGDKLTITGILSADGKSIPARSVYFMTKADIAAKNAKESEQWRLRGITGRVISVNTQTNQIGVDVRTLMGSSTVTLTPKNNAKFLRYAPDSIRFDEAIVSSLADVKVGDMLRALGDKSTDGLGFAAEKVVAGAFQTIAGTVKSVDAIKNEVVIKNLQTNKDVTIVIGDTSLLKRFPAEQAEQMVRFQMMGAGGARPVGQGGTPVKPVADPSGGQGQAPGAGRPGFGGQRAAGGIDDMLDRLPSMTTADLKVGDIIALSSTKNGNSDRIKAIKLLAGVEPFLRAAQANGGRRGQSGVDAGFSIPGLDGISFP
jgi:hypothetical protein